MSNIIKCPNCLTEHLTGLSLKPGDKRLFKGNCKNCHLPLKFKLNSSNQYGLLEEDFISFQINGVTYQVSNEYPLTMSLNDYLRDVLNLKGSIKKDLFRTKLMCKEGGCGSCLVNAEIIDYSSKMSKNISINSCLFPLYSCDGLKFTTIEGIGSKKTGFNEIQKRIADNNGTQCGWCTPGMVMNMYNLLAENPRPEKQEIEDSMDGNICRCTGYRSILTAMKSFAKDEKPIDIEDLNRIKCLNKSKSCLRSDKNVHLIRDQAEWFVPKDMKTLNDLLSQFSSTSYRLVSGNTSVGIYKSDGPFQVYIDLKSIEELYMIEKYDSLVKIGSQVTLTSLINAFEEFSSSSGFEYLHTLAHHLKKIANRGVRNTASWSGNLCMKNFHKEFPSDVFICLETANAQLTVTTPSGISKILSPLEFMSLPLQSKLLYSFSVSPLTQDTFLRTYKIIPRSQNAHAYVNAGFRFSIDPKTMVVKSLPCILYGGISPEFGHASNTEKFLVGKSLLNENVLNSALEILNSEITPNNDPVLASPEYRRSLALALFYKFVLEICQKEINPKYFSAFQSLIDTRPLSQGSHTFPDQDPAFLPVTKPIPKLNAYLQASGEAKYTYDKYSLKNQLEGAFIQSKIANCQIGSIDDSLAKNHPGVVSILYAKDIPGKNSFMPDPFPPELLFAEDKIDYAGQAIGLVLAESAAIAQEAAKLVKITYKDQKVPILNLFDGIKSGSFFPKPVDDFKYGDPDSAMQKCAHIIEGDVYLDTQAHFYMENQNATCEETEDGYDIDCATQWIDLVQNGVQYVLGLPTCNQYKIGCDENSKLIAIKIDWYCDAGNSPSDNSMPVGSSFIDNVYNCPNWFISSNLVKTNLPANTAVRSPGFFPAIAIMETMIEHVSTYFKKDPIEIRQINLYKK
ncbi:xanthine dehydrogenase-like isoform X1, partial [Brachionus plicatilis]